MSRSNPTSVRLPTVHDAGVPLALVLSGGYARRERLVTSAEDTPALHATVFREAATLYPGTTD